MRPKGEETGEGIQNDCAKHLPSKERIVDFSQSVLLKPAMITSLPKLNLPVFDGDPCAGCDVDLSLVRLNDCTKRLYKTLPANPQHTKRLSNTISLINLEHISDYIHNLTGT